MAIGKKNASRVGWTRLLGVVSLVVALAWYMRMKRTNAEVFTLMTMSYLPRSSLLEGFIETYEHCPGVGDILVVWNGKEGLENIQSLASPKVRIRVEPSMSINNRYKPDHLIRTRAVLSLDDDLRIPCTSLSKAFEEWKRHPERLVGWFPRLIRPKGSNKDTLEYLGEPEAIRENRYNMILTGAAFIDSSVYFSLYWSPKIQHLRALVDSKTNCDDILMNFVVASRACGQNGSPKDCKAIQYQRPLELIDLSHSSGVGISHDEIKFLTAANECIQIYRKEFGLPLTTEEFSWTMELPRPYCNVSVSRLFCSYDTISNEFTNA